MPIDRKYIPRLWRQLLPLNKPSGDDPYAVSKKGRVRWVVNIRLDNGGVDPHFSSMFQLLPLGIAEDLPVYGFPRLFTERLDALLEHGLAWVLLPVQPGEFPESP